MATNQIRIAIIGGGLAGASLANALSPVPHISVQLFEAAPTFSERGAAVGLSVNAQLALKETLEASERILKNAGSVPMTSTRVMIGSGPGAGSVVLDFAEDEINPELIVHRASLLRELLAPLPQGMMHPKKKLVRIDANDASVKIMFEDGTVYEFDAVIGADGVFSSVRDHVLETEQKKYTASPGGFWDCRVLVPIEKAKAALGEDLFLLNRQYGWIGDGAFIMHDVLENGTMVQCVISGIEPEPTHDRKHILTKELLVSELGSWLSGPIANGAIDLILDQDEPRGYSQWEHKETPTYARGRVCIIGDAAHATTPWQGAGVGQVFEDVMVLSALLSRLISPDKIELAFKAYDVTRRPRAQQVIDSSRATGTILCGQSPEAGLNPERLIETLTSRWDFLQLDPKTHILTALAEFEELGGVQV